MRDLSYIRAEEKARQFAISIYKNTESFTGREGEALASHIREVVLDIITSLAVGHEQDDMRCIGEILYNAINASYKLDSLLLLADDLKCMNNEFHKKLAEENKDIRDDLRAYSQYAKFVSKMRDREDENGD